MRRSGGFTLLELMTVIAILGILAAIALPSFSYLGANTKVKSAATEMFLSMLRARSEAVKRNVSVVMAANSGGWAKGWKIFVDANGNSTYDTGERLAYEVAAQAGVTFITCNASPCSSDAGVNAVTFLTSGRLQGAAPKFQVSSPNPKQNSVTRCVTSEITGRPYIDPKLC